MNSMEDFDRYASDYIRNFNPSVNTLRSKRSTIRKFLEWCDEKGLDWRYLNSGHILEFLGGGGFGSHTQKLFQSRIRTFYDWAVDKDICKRNPASVKYRPTVTPPRAVEKGLLPSEVRDLMNAVPFMTDKEKFILLYSLARPVRLNELAQLKWGDVDMRNGVIQIGVSFKTKTGKARWHSIPKKVVPVLERLAEGRCPDDWVIPGGAQGAFAAVREIYRKGGVEQNGRGAHAFRHYCISRLIHEKNFDVAVVAELSGNSPTTIMEFYLGRAPQQKLLDAMAAMEN